MARINTQLTAKQFEALARLSRQPGATWCINLRTIESLADRDLIEYRATTGWIVSAAGCAVLDEWKKVI